MFKALLIGCGNIGAMYDFDTEAVSTYAKAFHFDKEVDFDVYDLDPAIACKVADRYGVSDIRNLDAMDLENYNIVVVATPTETHHAYLSRLLNLSPRLVICEKPVDVDVVGLNILSNLYRESGSKVMVNYFRRFQPKIILLKQRIASILSTQPCTNIVVTYQRGFHNNASHAIDLLEFVFSEQISLTEAQVTHSAFDEFDNDPTVSLSCLWNGINLQFMGLANATFSHFEIALYFSNRAVLLKDGANLIEEFSAPPKKGAFYSRLQLESSQSGVTDNYMAHVVSHAKQLLRLGTLDDNFLHSVSISDRILKLLNR